MRSLCLINPRWIVLLDSPPLLVTSEGRALLTVAGQVVLVVRAGLTPRQAVVDAIALFDERQAGGIVLNEARVGLMQRYYGYGTYGSYGTYGADGDDGSPKI
jgi:Mrp family chromosome partitioning ATPase